MRKFSRAAAIQDISGFGRCSLTVIIPVLSAMSVQVCPVPTAVLSAHTGFGKMTMNDLTGFMMPALNDYQKLGVEFDSIFSGFLASEEQIDGCLAFFKTYNNALKFVDPVMGDCGTTYHTYTEKMCGRMIELVREADIITPNLTEAAILLGEDYPLAPISAAQAKDWLKRLSDIGPERVVVTSVAFDDETVCNICYDRSGDRYFKTVVNVIPKQYSGSGDIFASVVLGSVLKGDSLEIAVGRAAAFTEAAIKYTYENSENDMDGILLEPCLKWFYENHTGFDYKQL